jgi:hypothetical protein
MLTSNHELAPLIRLRVDHSEYPVIAVPKITNIFTKAQIANLGLKDFDCVFFRRRVPLK